MTKREREFLTESSGRITRTAATRSAISGYREEHT